MLRSGKAYKENACKSVWLQHEAEDSEHNSIMLINLQ